MEDHFQLEVIVFGRGVGECVLVRYDIEKWVIVDSFLESGQQPVALWYLEKNGIPFEHVRLISLSHWHDDHIKGAATIVKSCPNALVSFSYVLCRDEFISLLKVQSKIHTDKISSGVVELDEVAKILSDERARMRYSLSQKILIEDDSVRIEALSPSDDDLRIFLEEIKKWFESPPGEKVLVKPQRNDTSVVLALKCKEHLLLLGGDLEVHGKYSGWQAVHEVAWNARGRATLFKVPHYGSVNAHYDPVWKTMLADEAAVAVSPFGKGRKKLPSPDDVRRILENVSTAYASSDGYLPKAKRRPGAVEKTLAEGGIEVFRRDMQLGFVRFVSKGDQWEVEKFGTARELSLN